MEALARSLEEHSTIESELNQLRDVVQMVVIRVFGLGPSTSTPAIKLAKVPDMVQMLISDNVFHGALRVLTSVATHYPDLDFDVIYGGYAGGRSLEEIQTLGHSLSPHAQTITAHVTA